MISPSTTLTSTLLLLTSFLSIPLLTVAASITRPAPPSTSTHNTTCGIATFTFTTGPVNGSCVIQSATSSPPGVYVECVPAEANVQGRFCVMEVNTKTFEGNGYGPTVEVVLEGGVGCGKFSVACTPEDV